MLIFSGSGPILDRPAASMAGSGSSGSRWSMNQRRPKRRESMNRNCLLLLKLIRKWACFSNGFLGGESRNLPVMPSWMRIAKSLSVMRISRLPRRVMLRTREAEIFWAAFFQELL